MLIPRIYHHSMHLNTAFVASPASVAVEPAAPRLSFLSTRKRLRLHTTRHRTRVAGIIASARGNQPSPPPSQDEETAALANRTHDSVPDSPSASHLNGKPSSKSKIKTVKSASKLPSPSKSSPSKKKSRSQEKIPLNIGPLSISLTARTLLYTVPFMWGSFAPAVRYLFAQNPHQDPSVFNTERLLLSLTVYSPILYREFRAFLAQRSAHGDSVKKETDPNRFSFFPIGIELGFYVFLANIAQVIGLEQTSASRAAFLVQLQTVFVPVLGIILNLVDSVSLSTWVSAAVAVGGVALLSSDKGAHTESSLMGDSLEIMSALFFSGYIVRLSRVANRVNPIPLVATKIAVQAFLSITWATVTEVIQNSPGAHLIPQEPWTLPTVLISVAVVIWTGLVPSALSGWAQTKGQQGVPASQAALIFATQPLWATAIAAVTLGESFGSRGLVGGALIVFSTLIPNLTQSIPFLKKLDQQKNKR